MLLKPPITAPMKAGSRMLSPMLGKTPIKGLMSTPAMPASSPPTAQLTASVVRT